MFSFNVKTLSMKLKVFLKDYNKYGRRVSTSWLYAKLKPKHHLYLEGIMLFIHVYSFTFLTYAHSSLLSQGLLVVVVFTIFEKSML